MTANLETALADPDASTSSVGCAGLEPPEPSVSDFPHFTYSMKEVKAAGEAITGDLTWNDRTAPELRRNFAIANSYREAHALPMRSIRGAMRYYIGSHELEGIAVARLKRMQAIRRKLGRMGLHLNQLQDLGGCRAILASISDVKALVAAMRECRHDLRKENDYIAEPKKDGYRSHHLMFNFCGKSDQRAYDGRRIEVQIRTRLQHSWATAVEAVGMFRGEYLKGSKGDEGWLRLFQLMSGEFAIAERCPTHPDLPERVARRAELKELDSVLEATKTLDTLSHATKWRVGSVLGPDKPRYFLIKYNNATKQVSVEPHFAPKSAMLSYDNAEAMDNSTGKETINVVLVEADKVQMLADAYPNYFGDVQLFRARLQRLTQGKELPEYEVVPQERVRRTPQKRGDLSWVHAYKRWK